MSRDSLPCLLASLRAVLALCAVFLLSASVPFAQDDSHTLSQADVDYLDNLQLGPGVDWELGIFELGFFPRSGVQVLFPNDDPADAERSAQTRKGAKLLYERVVLELGGALSGYLATGQLAGVEIEWYPDAASDPVNSNRLPALAEIWELDETGASVLRARMLAYNTAQLQARDAELVVAQGGALASWTVWANAGMAATGGADEGVRVTGSDNDMHGRVDSAADVSVISTGNEFVDGVRYVGQFSLNAQSTAYSSKAVTSISSPAVPFTEATARSEALAAGTYYAGDVEFTSLAPPPAGLVFAEGDIRVTGLQLAGSWTFASATGKVVISGDQNTMTPYKDFVAAVAFAGRVAVTGDGNQISGELHAVGDSLLISGSDNVLRGLMVAADLSITGNSNVLSDGTDPHLLP
jgi:hypothetical protein